MRLRLHNSSRIAFVVLLAAVAGPRLVAAQNGPTELPLDRWLVSERLALASGDPASSADPLAGPEGAAFPDRDLEVGSTYWTLVREDGVRGLKARTVFSVLDARGGARDEPGDQMDEALGGARGEASVLAHVYLKAPEDRTVVLDAIPLECQQAHAWLNGQSIELGGSPVQIRLAGGWNTLLVRLRESADCAPELSATLRPGIDVDEESGTSGTLTGIRVQASRPPGVRRQYPEGWVSLGAIEPVENLLWRAGAEDLTGAIRYDYVAWGHPLASGRGAGEGGRETEPPAFDVTGTWDLTLFGPTGIQRTTVEFQMAEDGSLEGRVAGGDREGGFRGAIEDGRVSGDRIFFAIAFTAARGRPIETRLEGLVEGDFISGNVDFGGGGGRVGDFQSRFEATRRPAGAGDGAERRDPDERPDLPGRRRGGRASGRPGGLPGTGARVSDEQLRARIRSRLLPPPEPTTPVPDTAAFELRLGGPRIYEIARDLEPAVRRSQESPLPFKRLRELALSSDGAEVRLRWSGEERRLRRTVSAEGILRALHRPITLTMWSDAGGGRYSGTWRVPEALSGFTLRLLSPAKAPTFTVNGRTLTAAQAELCSPCRKGERLEIVMTVAADAPANTPVNTPDGSPGDPQVRVVEPGYPDATDAADAADSGDAGRPAEGAPVPSAAEWLRALRGDNRRYRELAARYAGGG